MAHRSFWTKCGQFVTKNPLIILLAVSVYTLGLMSQIPKIKIDLGLEVLYDENDPGLKKLKELQEVFGNDQIATIMIKVDDMFDVESLIKLKKFHTQIEEKAPYIESVDSLYSSGYTEAREDGVIHVGSFDKEWPEDQLEAEELKRLVLREKNLVGNFYSKDRKYYVLRAKMVPRITDPSSGETRKVTEYENKLFIAALRNIGSQLADDSFQLQFGSQAVLMSEVFDIMTTDTIIFTNLAFIISVIALFWLLRRISGVVLPICVVGVALFSTIGWMALLDAPVTSTFQLIPTLLLLIGIGYSIHYLTHFYSDYNKNGNKAEALIHALEQTATPMLLTSLTTIGGFLSFGVSDIVAIRELGYESAYGVASAFALTVFMIPALMMYLPIKKLQTKKVSYLEKHAETIFGKVADIATERPWTVISTSSVFVILGVYFTLQLKIMHDSYQWFQETSEIRQSVQALNEHVGASNNFDVFIDTKEEEGVFEPALLAKIDKFQNEVMSLRGGRSTVGFTNSYLDIIKRVHEELRARGDYPNSVEGVAQEVLLVQSGNAEAFDSFVDEDAAITRINVLTSWTEATDASGLVKKVKVLTKDIFGEQAVVTGTGALICQALDLMVSTLFKSLIMGAIVILVLMFLMLKSVRLGLVSVFPNFAPIAIGLGFLYLYGYFLDLATVMVGAISMGLVVDDTIHFLHNYKFFRAQGMDSETASRKTLVNIGPALVTTTLVLFSGLIVLVFSKFRHISAFGATIAVTIGVALLFDLFVLPSILKIVDTKVIDKKL